MQTIPGCGRDFLESLEHFEMQKCVLENISESTASNVINKRQPLVTSFSLTELRVGSFFFVFLLLFTCLQYLILSLILDFHTIWPHL